MKTATVTTGKMINGNPKPEVPVEKIVVPDMWHLAMSLRDHGHGMTQQADALLDTWHLAHDLLNHAKAVHAANVAMFSNHAKAEDPPCIECGAPESGHDEGCTR